MLRLFVTVRSAPASLGTDLATSPAKAVAIDIGRSATWWLLGGQTPVDPPPRRPSMTVKSVRPTSSRKGRWDR